MDLSKILSISGKHGLYKLVGEAKNNVIVESLIDGKKQPAFSHQHISSLHEISIYTKTDDVPLADVLKKLHKVQEGKTVDKVKKMSGEDLKILFEKVLPDYDKNAVYVSDIKKVFTWYNILLENDLLDFTKEEESKDKKEESVNTDEGEDSKEETKAD